jgi:hypothetical protein
MDGGIYENDEISIEEAAEELLEDEGWTGERIRGDYDQLMEIVKNCQLVAAKAGCPAMHTYVKISYKPEGEVLTIDKKVTKHHQE